MMPEPHSTQLRPPSRAKSLACPTCGDVAVGAFDVADNDGLPSLIQTHCICPAEHLWSIRWMVAA